MLYFEYIGVKCMKKKLLSFILAICMLLPCSLALTACNGNSLPDNPHTHEWVESTWEKDATEHWHKCKGCEDKKDKNEHSFEEGVCSVCGHTKQNQDANLPVESSIRDLEIITMATEGGGVANLVKLPDGKTC